MEYYFGKLSKRNSINKLRNLVHKIIEGEREKKNAQKNKTKLYFYD